MQRRILHLIASNFVGGPEKQVLHHAQDLKGSEYEIHVGSFQDGDTLPEVVTTAQSRGLPEHVLSGGVKWAPVRDLARLLRQQKFNILCTHGYKANIIGRVASARTKTPHVAFVRGWTAETPRVKVYERIERLALRYAPFVVCVSARQAAQLASSRAGRTAPIVIQNAMLPEATAANDLALTRAAADIPEGAFVYGSLGRLSVEKGHRYLLEAFALLLSRVSADRVFLVLLGEGREQPALEQLAAAKGISGRVLFAGFQRNGAQWLRLLDCMVQPSLTEGTPNSVLEALLAEVPIVATAVGGVPDLIENGSSGLLVPPAEPTALADAMQAVLESPDLRLKLANAKHAIDPAYRPETQRKALIDLYERVLRNA